MTDGIDGVAGANGALAPKKAQQTPQKVERVNASDGRGDGSDLVSLTNTAETLSALKKEVGDLAPVDRQKVEAIKQADRDFYRMTAESGVEGWMANFAPDGAMFQAGQLVRGEDAVREMMTPAFAAL